MTYPAIRIKPIKSLVKVIGASAVCSNDTIAGAYDNMWLTVVFHCARKLNRSPMLYNRIAKSRSAPRWPIICFVLLSAMLSRHLQAHAADNASSSAKPNDQAELNKILDSGITTPAQGHPLPDMPKLDEMPILPSPSRAKDSRNRTVSLGPLYVGPLLEIAALRPVRLEASYSQALTLRDALVYALQQSLPIRINAETYQFQKYTFLASLAGFLPTYSTDNIDQHANNFPASASSPNTNVRTYDNFVNIPVFQGGRIVNGSLLQYYRMKATKYQYNTSINDTLLNVFNAYYNAVLQRALVQIRIKSVEVSELQLHLNEDLYSEGAGTQFAIFQSRTQLELDKQALLQQEVASRLASLQLAYNMNLPLLANPLPMEAAVTEESLLDEQIRIEDLLRIALDKRPELRQYELLRMSASKGIGLAASALYPTANWFLAQSNTSTSRYPATEVASSRVNSMSYTFDANWTLTGLGLLAAGNIYSVRSIERQSLLQSNQVLMLVSQQVRNSYLNALAAREEIDVTAAGSAAAAEALRMANLRVQEGIGTNLELIQAQRDYIQTLINQVQAIIASNQAQAQVLHDTGAISIETLTTGIKKKEGTTGGTTQ